MLALSIQDLYNDYYEYDLVINTAFVSALLDAAPKLRTVLFCELNKDVVSCLSKFAARHPKRSITIYNFYFPARRFKKVPKPMNMRILTSRPLVAFM